MTLQLTKAQVKQLRPHPRTATWRPPKWLLACATYAVTLAALATMWWLWSTQAGGIVAWRLWVFSIAALTIGAPCLWAWRTRLYKQPFDGVVLTVHSMDQHHIAVVTGYNRANQLCTVAKVVPSHYKVPQVGELVEVDRWKSWA